DNKASGPDGYTAAFFKEAWDITATDVIKVIKEFFTNRILLKELNHTILALIPKEGSCDGGLSLIIARVIMDTLEEFKEASRLTPSLPKSTAYFCNVLNYTKLDILSILSFKKAKLQVKYLGVPLFLLQLLYRDCKELKEKVKGRINDWKKLEQLMRGFLWCQDEMKNGRAKVAWEIFCLPKRKGGLGIRRLEMFNKALITSHIWSLLLNKESLWVKWIHSYKLNGHYF
nr:hypothetical protein [Tanacetum cinerariifolium]